MSSDDRRSHGRGVASGNSSEAHRGGMSHSAASRTAAATFATPDPDARHALPEHARPRQNDDVSSYASRLEPAPVFADDAASQELKSAPNSQQSTMPSSSDQVFTPPASDTSAGGGAASGGPVDGLDSQARSTQDSQLLQLSAIAAAQDKMTTAEAYGGARKRMADGEVKPSHGSTSPVKGHSRNVSAISTASTTASTIGDLSTELRTRLSYAMVKVHNGWQAHTFDEVESMASQAVSPTSSASTAHRRNGSSASPRLPMSATAAAQVHFAQGPVAPRRRSDTPPLKSSKKPTLAPPATIQPHSAMHNLSAHPRRNSNPRYTPTTLSHSHSASPHTPAQPPRLNTSQTKPQSLVDPILFSPHQNVREQEVIETLMFMRSPGNSANLKHSFSPSGSPGPQGDTPRGGLARHALPSGPRKTLPSERPPNFQKKVGFDRSPAMPPPSSPMDLDSPQQLYQTPNRGTPRRRANGGSSHFKGAMSLPAGLGVSGETVRRTIGDDDIERMLDRAGADNVDSSDDEEIQLPPGVPGIMRA